MHETVFSLQLKHVFSGKYIHVSTTQTSRRNKNNMLVGLRLSFIRFNFNNYYLDGRRLYGSFA